MNTIFIGTRSFGEAQNKATRAYAQSGQYHTIVESRVHQGSKFTILLDEIKNL